MEDEDEKKGEEKEDEEVGEEKECHPKNSRDVSRLTIKMAYGYSTRK
eukprot:CAMPEP_0206427538 /NCGR_PEP_ID=MMETSP0324_2-20121206/5096_1 /ASSEMBLY_ACC=CAM_ASM_000836 /TAXON_ID=2866 /ORGANISM="Crypthecodinium cohnii, Strain Seligo" /LENGTH=46 /DNA_ID= /DNA_START= /DNA_END= /DNA_ORIENTATION=